MSPIKIFAFAITALALCPVYGPRSADATTLHSIACVAPAGLCGGIAGVSSSSGDTISAANYSNAPSPNTIGGGGLFQDIGLCDNSGPYVTTAAIAQGDTTIPLTTTTGLVVGSLVALTGVLDSNTQIASIKGSQITITVPAEGPAGSSATLAITPNNTGTIFKETTSSHCVIKINYGGDPHEWGAVGDGVADDSAPLAKWLAGPGPWRASVPAVYMTTNTLDCWPNAHLEAPANDSHEEKVAPVVAITVGSGFTAGSSGSPKWVMTMHQLCRISGLSINASLPGCSGTDAPNNCYVGAVNVQEAGAVIDGHSVIEHGFNNVNCPTLAGELAGTNAGLQLKDSQFTESYNDDVVIACPNVRIVGDIIGDAGIVAQTQQTPTAIGINTSSEDITISNGNVEQNTGIGILLNGTALASVTGMFVEKSGIGTITGSAGGAGIEIDGGKHITICGNHLRENDNNTDQSATAHIRFGMASSNAPNDVSLCGNVYDAVNTAPTYVYDVKPLVSTAAVTLYENPQLQTSTTSVFSSGATSAGLPARQALPCTTSYTCSTGIPPRTRARVGKHKGS